MPKDFVQNIFSIWELTLGSVHRLIFLSVDDNRHMQFIVKP